MPVVERGVHHDTEVLIRQVDNMVDLLRVRHRGGDLEAVERLADRLRQLIVSTAPASAADRAKVRAAVHHFMLRAGRGGRLPDRPAIADRRIVEDLARHVDTTGRRWATGIQPPHSSCR